MATCQTGEGSTKKNWLSYDLYVQFEKYIRFIENHLLEDLESVRERRGWVAWLRFSNSPFSSRLMHLCCMTIQYFIFEVFQCHMCHRDLKQA